MNELKQITLKYTQNGSSFCLMTDGSAAQVEVLLMRPVRERVQCIVFQGLVITPFIGYSPSGKITQDDCAFCLQSSDLCLRVILRLDDEKHTCGDLFRLYLCRERHFIG